MLFVVGCSHGHKDTCLGPGTFRWGGGLPLGGVGDQKVGVLRLAKSRESYRRIASESYRCDLNR